MRRGWSWRGNGEGGEDEVTPHLNPPPFKKGEVEIGKQREGFDYRSMCRVGILRARIVILSGIIKTK